MRLLPAVFCSIVLLTGSAAAAPQVLGLVATADAPTELKCENGICSAEFSAICLQQGREAPKKGTQYQVVDASSLTIVLTGEDGAKRRLPPSGLTISSARSHAAVTMSLPASTLGAFGGGRVAVNVGQDAALAPLPEPNDPAPQTTASIDAAVETFRKIGQAAIDDGSTVAEGYRGLMAIINALPRSEKPLSSTHESRLTRTTLQGIRMSREARAFTLERLEFCETLSLGAWYSGGLRPCLQQQHDALITHKNHAYWNAAGAGS